LDYPSNTRLGRVENKTRRIALTALLASAALASNYLLIGTANVKLMDLIVFTSGNLQGPALGALTGALIWLVYGTLNPYGFSLPILLATMLGETLYGLAGGLYKGTPSTIRGFSFGLGAVGFLLTFLYDLFTNVVSGLTAGIPVVVALATGVPFTLVHTASNFLLFGFAFHPLNQSIRSLMNFEHQQ